MNIYGVPFFFLLGLGGFSFLALKFHAPVHATTSAATVLERMAEVPELKGQVDVRYDHFQANVYGQVANAELKVQALALIQEHAPSTTSIEDHIRLVGELDLPDDKRELQEELVDRLKSIRFSGERSDLGYADDKGLRLIAERIREVDPEMPLLLVSRASDPTGRDLGLKRARYVRDRLASFGLSRANMGAICELKESKEDPEAPETGTLPWVLLLVLE